MERMNLSSIYTEAEKRNQNELENYECRLVGSRDLPSLVKKQNQCIFENTRHKINELRQTAELTKADIVFYLKHGQAQK